MKEKCTRIVATLQFKYFNFFSEDRLKVDTYNSWGGTLLTVFFLYLKLKDPFTLGLMWCQVAFITPA